MAIQNSTTPPSTATTKSSPPITMAPVTILTTTASTTTTTIATTAEITTTYSRTTLLENVTSYKNTTAFSNNTATAGLQTTTVGMESMNTTFLIIAIATAVLVCVIIILIVCFVTYRRGRRKRIESAAQKIEDAKVNPKNPRYNELKNMNRQPQETVPDNDRSATFAGTVVQSDNPNNIVNVKVQIEHINSPEKINSQNGGSTAESQYINLALIKEGASSSAGNHNQSEVRESLYENLSPEESYVTPVLVEKQAEESIYENTNPTPEENIYEQPIKELDQIYVDMN